MLTAQKQALDRGIVGISPIMCPKCEDAKPFVAVSFPPRLRDVVTDGVAVFVKTKCNKATAHHTADGRICVTVGLKTNKSKDAAAFAEGAEEALEVLWKKIRKKLRLVGHSMTTMQVGHATMLEAVETTDEERQAA